MGTPGEDGPEAGGDGGGPPRCLAMALRMSRRTWSSVMMAPGKRYAPPSASTSSTTPMLAPSPGERARPRAPPPEKGAELALEGPDHGWPQIATDTRHALPAALSVAFLEDADGFEVELVAGT